MKCVVFNRETNALWNKLTLDLIRIFHLFENNVLMEWWRPNAELLGGVPLPLKLCICEKFTQAFPRCFTGKLQKSQQYNPDVWDLLQSQNCGFIHHYFLNDIFDAQGIWASLFWRKLLIPWTITKKSKQSTGWKGSLIDWYVEFFLCKLMQAKSIKGNLEVTFNLQVKHAFWNEMNFQIPFRKFIKNKNEGLLNLYCMFNISVPLFR